MKIYPKHNAPEGAKGFSEEELRRGDHWLYADVTCEDCKKVQALSQVGGFGGPCIRCGGRTS